MRRRGCCSGWSGCTRGSAGGDGVSPCRAAVWAALLGAVPGLVAAQAAPALTPLAGPPGGLPGAPWAWAGVPGQKAPPTRFALELHDGQPVLRIEARASYGNLLHRLDGVPAGELAWRWQLPQPLAAADLRTKAGDDAALKVCALFDMPRQAVPFVERQLLRLAEARVGEPLPNATLCYVWDTAWPPGTVLPNAYSARVRYLTLGQAGGGWQAVRRRLDDDFRRAFGAESPTVPPLRAVAVGADADNTGGHSVGHVADLVLVPAAPR